MTHADIYDRLEDYNSIASVFVNKTVQAFQATWSYDIPRCIAIDIASFNRYERKLSNTLLGLFGGRHTPETRDILNKFERLKQSVFTAQQKYFSWQERLSRTLVGALCKRARCSERGCKPRLPKGSP